MAILSNMDLATLIIEKVNHSGVSFLKGIGRLSEADAANKLGMLQHDHRHLYNGLTRNYIFNNLNDIVYQLSLDKSHILGIALYKELHHTSLQAAYEHQKELMSKLGIRRIDPNNIWQRMKSDAIEGMPAISHITETAIPVGSQQKPRKPHMIAYILLAAVIGFFYYLWDEAVYRHDTSKSSRYFLFLTFSIMALVALLIYGAYRRSVIRRINRGERIEKG